MTGVFLQSMVNDLQWDALPFNWTAFCLETFSPNKRLWNYQQEALVNALKALWKYYEDFADYQAGEDLDANLQRKRRFFAWYQANGLHTDLDIGLDHRTNRTIANLLSEYYEAANGKVAYWHFINRMSFWMATGSGKTLVLVKLIQVLRDLIQWGEVPPYDILVLTHRDDLIEQLKAHVTEFNAAHSDLFIRLRELREYPAAKREHPSLFQDREITVFYYRSDNLSDEQKEKIIDFRNYDDRGRWYILLDEAHKGDKEDSKRQHIYSILSRNGFLFNFSATFTDSRDLVTTVSNFNLAEFIEAGYGKHIAILKQEIRAFRDKDDYTNEEKQRVVLKSLLMLAYARKFYEDIRSVGPDLNSRRIYPMELYHRPLLLTLVNSVNTEDADLKLFFRELERIGKGDLSADIWEQAKAELWEELKDRPAFLFEEGKQIEVDAAAFQGLSHEDLLVSVYNASSPGEIEILVRPSNRQELAFKLKSADRPFALIKIGDISGWLKEELAGYEVNERFDDEGYFERLNADDSDINILMGSRSFYEGWDSNRPNVINFINIGTGTDAKKFILQSVGRGVRIEPLRDRRKRLLPLYNAKQVEADLFQALQAKVLPLETLFIFGTNRNALQTVIEQLDQEKSRESEQQLSLFLNAEAQCHTLLIPTYRQADRPRVEEERLTKFEITADELRLLRRYAEYISDDRVLLALYETEPMKLRAFRHSLQVPDDCYKYKGKPFKNIHLLVRRLLDYFSVLPEEFEQLKVLEDEIRHFKHVKVSLKDISELQGKVERVSNYPTHLKELRAQYGAIPPEEYDRRLRAISDREQFDSDGKKIVIRYVANHYYIPLILSESDKIDYIKHVIKTPSEVEFVNRLEEHVCRPDHKFKDFDWWLFSKLDESLDQVYIPYYNPARNDISHFKPDFIFWLQQGDNYFIVFIDPKGTEHTDYEHKIDGYKALFVSDGNGRRVFPHEGLKVRVFTFLYTDDVNELAEGYKEYWFDDIGKAMTSLAHVS